MTLLSEPKIVPPTSWRTQAWRNGGGVTHEVLRCDDVVGMLFRLSVAEVASAGPFSTFPGVDRQIMLLEGKGGHLTVEGGNPIAVVEPFMPRAFVGEVAVSCALVDGPMRDLNLMTRRDAARAELRVQGGALGQGAPAASVAGADLRVIFVCDGEIEVTGVGVSRPLSRHTTLITAAEQSVGVGGSGCWAEVHLWLRNQALRPHLSIP